MFPMRSVSFFYTSGAEETTCFLIRAGVKPTPTRGSLTRWVGAGVIPARTERAVALTSPSESLKLGRNVFQQHAKLKGSHRDQRIRHG